MQRDAIDDEDERDELSARWRLLEDLDDWLRLPMLALALAWAVIVVIDLTGGSNRVLETVGTVIWILFIAEFLLRLALAPEKGRFLRSSWLTIIALVVPALRLVRVLAVFRAASSLRAVRLVRLVGTANRSMRALRTSLARRKVGFVAGFTLVVVVLGTAGMWAFERGDEVSGGFSSVGEALWWTVMLMTSIGSEYWPQTGEGRVLTALLSFYGLGVLGYITATLASFFVGRDAEEPAGPVAGAEDIAALRAELRAVRAELARLAGQSR